MDARNTIRPRVTPADVRARFAQAIAQAERILHNAQDSIQLAEWAGCPPHALQGFEAEAEHAQRRLDRLRAERTAFMARYFPAEEQN